MTEIICIGSVLWDVIGHTAADMPPGADRPGRIERLPGGVAMNIAMAVRARGLRPRLLTHIGRDPAGEELIRAAEARDIDASLAHRTDHLPTDQYMAIEGPEGLVAAVADAHALETAGAAILAPMEDGRLGSASAPYEGVVAIDGNLTEALLGEIAASPAFSRADIRLAPASPGKAERLRPLLRHPGVTLYVNLEETGVLAGRSFEDAATAAAALRDAGVGRALVTDGGRAACAASAAGEIVALPPATAIRRVTGAGDVFMSAHIAADLAGAEEGDAFRTALKAAAAHVGGEPLA